MEAGAEAETDASCKVLDCVELKASAPRYEARASASARSSGGCFALMLLVENEAESDGRKKISSVRRHI